MEDSSDMITSEIVLIDSHTVHTLSPSGTMHSGSSQSVSPGGKWIPMILRLIGNCLFSFSLTVIPLDLRDFSWTPALTL